MPMNTRWSTGSMRRKCSTWSRISARRQVAAELHRAGRAERAGQRAARLRRDADRAAAVAVAHQHGLDGAAVGGAEQRLDRAVLGVRLVGELQRGERHARRPARRAARPAGRSSRRSPSRRSPSSATPGGRGRRAGRDRPGSSRAARCPRPYGGSVMRLAKFLAHAGVASRRAAEQLVFAGRVTVGGEVVRDPARDVGEGDAVAVDGRGVVARAPPRRLRAQQARRLREHGEGPAGTPDRRLARSTAASGCTRSAGSTPTRRA